MEFTLVKGWTTGTPTTDQILDQVFIDNVSGTNQIFNINLNSGFQDFSSADTVQLIYRANWSTGLVVFNVYNTDTFTSTNQINPEGVITSPYWTSGSNWDRLWLTGSAELSAVYGAKQVKSWDQTPEFDPIFQDFTIQVGDEIRFNGAEPYSRMIQDIILPDVDPQGLLRVRLNDSMSSAATPNYFLLRRYVDDSSYILLDSDKPVGSTSPGTIRSEYVTTKLVDNFAEATSNIIKSNAGS